MVKITAIIGWILVAVLLTVIVLQQFTIINYKAACKDYSAAVKIYETRFVK